MEYDIDNSASQLPFGARYFGTSFNLFAGRGGANLDTTLVTRVKERCRSYLKELLREMRKRSPKNITSHLVICLHVLCWATRNQSCKTCLVCHCMTVIKVKVSPIYDTCAGECLLERTWASGFER